MDADKRQVEQKDDSTELQEVICSLNKKHQMQLMQAIRDILTLPEEEKGPYMDRLLEEVRAET